jgi:hypothetical protein
VAFVRPAVVLAQLVQSLQAAAASPAADVNLNAGAVPRCVLVHVRANRHHFAGELVARSMRVFHARELPGQDLLIGRADRS